MSRPPDTGEGRTATVTGRVPTLTADALEEVARSEGNSLSTLLMRIYEEFVTTLDVPALLEKFRRRQAADLERTIAALEGLSEYASELRAKRTAEGRTTQS